MTKQNLSIDTTVLFAKSTYGEEKTQTAVDVFSHCWAVARVAEKIAHKLFQDMRGDVIPQDSADIITAIVHAAILSETIHTKRQTFESIADVANVQIAAMVSTLSRDIRLVETKRDIEYRGRLSQSTVATQIIAVAAIVCTAQEVIKLLTDNAIAAIPKARKILAQLDGDLLCVHAASRYYVLRMYAHAARNLINDANQLIKKMKAEARLARNIEKNTAGLRTRAAAKKSATNEPEKQEAKRGRKRIADQHKKEVS